MTRDRIAAIGFQHPVRSRRPLTPRNVAFAELIMTSALVISIAVAATAVGIGIARADVAGSFGGGHDGTVAIAAVSRIADRRHGRHHRRRHAPRGQEDRLDHALASRPFGTTRTRLTVKAVSARSFPIMIRLAAAGLAALVSTSAFAQSADLPFRVRQSECRDRRDRARQSLGARLPARRPHAGHRARRAAAHRHARRQIVAAGRRRAAGVRARPGRTARRHPRPQLRAEPHDLFLLRRSVRGRRPHVARARETRRRRGAEARRPQHHLPPGGPAFERQPFGCRIVQMPDNTSVPHARRSLTARATRRRISAIISARSCASAPTARCRRTIRS